MDFTNLPFAIKPPNIFFMQNSAFSSDPAKYGGICDEPATETLGSANANCEGVPGKCTHCNYFVLAQMDTRQSSIQRSGARLGAQPACDREHGDEDCRAVTGQHRRLSGATCRLQSLQAMLSAEHICKEHAYIKKTADKLFMQELHDLRE